MPWVEVELKPRFDWNEEALHDWSRALTAFLTDKGVELRPKTKVLPGYQVLSIGDKEKMGAIILSSSERLVLLEGWSLNGPLEEEFAYFTLRFAREMGAVALCTAFSSDAEEEFWRKMGGIIRSDPVALGEKIMRRKVDVHPLGKMSLLVSYEGQPALCLEPIACNAHAPGPVSLAQRRLEKLFGGRPLGFASRVAVHCPWEISKSQWDDLLAFSRLKSFDLLYHMITVEGLSLS